MSDERAPRAPAIRLAGWSNSGKTSFGVRLVEELGRRGYRVGVIKHASKHPAPPDHEDKDTLRYRDAGAAAVGGIFAQETVLRLPATETPLDELLAMLAGSVDLVIVEGYNDDDLPTIAVHRAEQGRELRLPHRGELVAIVSDDPDAPEPRYETTDIEGVSEAIEGWLTGLAG
jgi:molybdopterin-guanine dinucleotide biosynthesis protein B